MSAVVLSAVTGGVALWLLVPGTPSVAHRGHDPTRARIPLMVGLLLVVVLALPRELVAPSLVVAAGAWCARLLWRRRTAARLAETNSGRMVEVCDLLAAELSAGRPTEAALDDAAAAWSVIRPVAEACRLGGDVPAAFREASYTPGARGLRLLAGAWAVSQRTGGGLGPATLLMGSGAGADPWGFLFGTPWGWACLAAGGATGFAGLWWIELIAREADA